MTGLFSWGLPGQRSDINAKQFLGKGNDFLHHSPAELGENHGSSPIEIQPGCRPSESYSALGGPFHREHAIDLNEVLVAEPPDGSKLQEVYAAVDQHPLVDVDTDDLPEDDCVWIVHVV